MPIITCPADRKNDTRILWEAVFTDDSASFLDYYYTHKTAENIIDADVEDGRVKAMIHWNPYKLSVLGTSVETYYIVAVSTEAQSRHQGRMAALLRHGLERCHRQGVPFVWLIPAAEAIYRPFGFRYVGGVCGLKFPTRDICRDKDMPSAGASVIGCGSGFESGGYVIRPVGKKEAAGLCPFVNDTLAGSFAIYAIRNPAYMEDIWDQLHSCGGGIAAIYRRGETAGIMAHWPEDGILKITDFICDAELKSHGASFLEGPVREYFSGIYPQGLALGEISAINAAGMGNVINRQMLRITSAADALSLFLPDGGRGRAIRIRDDFIKENSGTYIWQNTGTSCGWRGTDDIGGGGRHTAADEISIDILAQYLADAAMYPYNKCGTPIYLPEIV